MTQLAPVARPPVAVLVHARRPLSPVDARCARSIPLDKPVRLGELVEQCARASGPARRVVSVNGAYILPKDADRLLQPNEIVVVEDVHEGGEGGKTSLRVVLMIAAFTILGPGGYAGLTGWQSALALTVANTLIFTLIPPARPDLGGGGEQPSPTYSTSLSGNQARLDGVIPVGYGYMRTYPDFAAQPYTEYNNDTNDQFYYAVLCVGKGKYSIKKIEIDDTNIEHFDEVETRIVNPGQFLTFVRANVATATEVSGLDLETGKYVGPYSACSPGSTVADIAFDIVFAGLGTQNGDSMNEKSVILQFEIRHIDNYGVPIGEWETLETKTISGASASQVRRSYVYTVSPPRRVEARVVRVDTKDDKISVANSPQWGGMRAYIAEPAPSLDFENSTYIEIKMRASEQLNGLSQRRIAVTWNRMLHTWHPDTGWSGSEVETRSIAWALADMPRNSDYGGGFTDSRVDLQTLYELDQIWAARQDRFDFYYDQATTLDQALRIAARAGRAVPIMRQGVYTFMRDQQQTLPVAMYTPRNMKRGSFSIDYILPTSETPDGVDIRYFSNRTWKWEKIRCPAPDRTVTQVVRPQEVTLEGVGGSKQAEREGLYMAADHYYRRRFPKWISQLDGLIPAYGSFVLAAHDVADWGQFGDVMDYDSGSLILTLTEPVTFREGTHYIRLHRSNGTPTDAIVVTQGPAANQVVLATALDFTPVTDAPGKDRTRFAFGRADEEAMPVRIKSIVPQSETDIEITTVAEDDRVHTADNALLPSPNEVQDPISADYSNIVDGDNNLLLLPALQALTIDVQGSAFTAIPDGIYRLQNDGYLYAGVGTPTAQNNQWLNVRPATAAQCGLFEVMATELPGAQGEIGEFGLLNPIQGTFGSWLPLDSNREWLFEPTGGVYRTMRVDIRKVGETVVRATAVITFTSYIYDGGGGGGA